MTSNLSKYPLSRQTETQLSMVLISIYHPACIVLSSDQMAAEKALFSEFWDNFGQYLGVNSRSQILKRYFTSLNDLIFRQAH